MSYRFLFVLLLSVYSLSLHAEKKFFKIKSKEVCSYSEEFIPSTIQIFPPDHRAEAIIDRIAAYSGLRQNFTLMATNVPSAAAITQSGRRYLLYNKDFLTYAKQKTHTYWSLISIMAHEVGHHLQGHTLDAQGSFPEKEIQADEYSGFVLQKMGATLEEAQLVINTFGSNEMSLTHPPKEARLRAIREGWERAWTLDGMAKYTPATIVPHQEQQQFMRYEVKNGLVKDVKTGLMWTRCSIGQKWNEATSTCKGVVTKYSWNDIVFRHFQYEGYNDWRVPSAKELETLLYCNAGQSSTVDETSSPCEGSYAKPTIVSAVFSNTPVDTPFWSSSPFEVNHDSAWAIDFSDGRVRYNQKSSTFAIRLVRNI